MDFGVGECQVTVEEILACLPY